jgi:hypothetical protein
MADVANKQQTKALILSTTVTRTRRHTELTKKLTKLTGNLCYAREHSVQFSCIVYTILLRVYGTLKDLPLLANAHTAKPWVETTSLSCIHVSHICT